MLIATCRSKTKANGLMLIDRGCTNQINASSGDGIEDAILKSKWALEKLH